MYSFRYQKRLCAKSYPVFQYQCSCANGAFCGLGAVIEPLQGMEKFVPNMGYIVHISIHSQSLLDRLGPVTTQPNPPHRVDYNNKREKHFRNEKSLKIV